MKNIDRRSLIKGAGFTFLTLALSACAGSGATGTSQATGDAGEDAQQAGMIVGGVLVTPYDEGYDSGIHHATIEVEDYGTIKIEMNATNAPITVSNFCHLANEGFYDGLTFHRIIEGFMVQGGDPDGNGTGGSGVTIKGEFSDNGITNAIQHKRGVISMARANDYNSGSSQFFIMQEANSSLDGSYAAFGRVTEGIEVVDAMAKVPVEDENGMVAEENKPHIKSIVIDD